MGAVVAVIAALGIITLLLYGSADHAIAGRDREGFEERAAQALVAAPAVDPAPVITTVEEQGRDRLPAETLSPLTEVRDLLAGTAGQSPEQAQPALDEAAGKLDGVLSQVETAVDEAPDQLTKIRLLHLQRVLEAIQASIESRLTGP
jgi:hypothetical protein